VIPGTSYVACVAARAVVRALCEWQAHAGSTCLRAPRCGLIPTLPQSQYHTAPASHVDERLFAVPSAVTKMVPPAYAAAVLQQTVLGSHLQAARCGVTVQRPWHVARQCA
jgi:hypothetical protein